MVNDALTEILSTLQTLQEELRDSRLEDAIFLIQSVKKKTQQHSTPLTDSQARDIFRTLRPGWKPLEFVRAVEKSHGIVDRSS